MGQSVAKRQSVAWEEIGSENAIFRVMCFLNGYKVLFEV